LKPTTVPDGVAWEALPTFDVLQKRSKLKVSALRVKLADVPCWRCPDNSVRYEESAAAEALGEPDAVELDEHEDELAGIDSRDRALMFLLREVLKQLGDARRYNSDVIAAMKAPLERGMELQEKLFSRLMDRLAKHEGDWDRVVKLTEDLMTAQLDRELKAKQVDASIKLRTEALGTVNENLPKFIDRYMVSAEATAALEFMASLPDQLFDIVTETDVLTDEQKAVLGKLRKGLEQRRAAAAKAAAKAASNSSSPAQTPPATPS
jgi:hypothetical protein